MIKRIVFATRSHPSPSDFSEAWRAALGSVADAPAGVRPARVTACVSLPEMTPNPKHDGIALEWFTDAEHLARYQAWRRTSEADAQLSEVVDIVASPIIVADEHVMRGGDWLEQRWRAGGTKLKHMAIARRAADLTLAQFFDRWRNRAGKVGTAVIPDEARGLAYIQNHPQLSGEDWAYDAINEVYFDQLSGLRTRIDYFQQTLGEQSEDDLVKENWFLAVEEAVVFDGA